MFRGLVAVVTGSSKGIGAVTAIELAKQGANVVVHGRQEKDVKNAAKLCRDEGVEVLEIVQDLSDTEKLGLIIDKTMEKLYRIDFLINNAAVNKDVYVEDKSTVDFDEIFKVNVYAPFFLSKAALPHLKKAKGCIINVSSVVGMRAVPSSVSYSMSKSALDMFTAGFSNEIVKDGIRVNSINPGLVDTEMFRNFSEQKKKFAVSMQPMGLISCEEIAKGIIYLCSSRHLTGTTLRIDGGCYNFA